MFTLPDDELEIILQLLETHSFAAIGLMYGASDKYNANHAVKRYLKHHGIDHRMYVKKREHCITCASVRPVLVTRPREIRSYTENGHIIHVFETRYAEL